MSYLLQKLLSSWATVILICVFFAAVSSVPARAGYMQRREELIRQDQSRSLGNNLPLNSKEKIISDYMVKLKRELIENARLNTSATFYPALSFFVNKELIDQSPIYKLIKKMPKGAALHIHDQSIASLEWLVKNATYRDHLYMCVDTDYYMIFKFMSKSIPNPGCEWKSVKEERAKAASAGEFDESIRRNISVLSKDPVAAYKGVNEVWARFNAYFKQVIGMIFYTPVYKDYYAQALKEFDEDNVQYMELRAQMWGITDLDGSTHDAEFGLNIYRNVTSDFIKSHPDFGGAKFIMSGLRFVKQQDIMAQIKIAMDLHQRYPDSYLGYDLVGQEDPYNPLVYYLDQLLYPSEQSPPVNLPYFFHAGETNWQQTAVDLNLADALLLNTTRIGHGYALTKHPTFAEMAKRDKVAIEVNPISNQLLKLVVDLRNHAAIPLMVDDFPIVISSDDPATWEAAPLSHDFYMAFMNMCGEDAGLGFLKQLALNSIRYSAMTEQEKIKLTSLWQRKWDEFITDSVRFITEAKPKDEHNGVRHEDETEEQCGGVRQGDGISRPLSVDGSCAAP